ncbi:phosphoserine transaminase [Oricola sp.]|uniref:phosphoserine transaminase n=1 Tax=Oricola sp. TaxID=1979950 RepID=UPI003BA93EBC
MTVNIPTPDVRPANPRFSSGPCSKRPNWAIGNIDTSTLGRSHRSKPGKALLANAIALTRALLRVPDTHRIGIVPASDTGAVEMALWSLLGARGVDMVAWESFGSGWVTDVVKQLKLEDVRRIEAAYGALPDLSTIDFSRDVVFTWNGTTSGVRVPNGDFIPADRGGLTICDATSAAFAQNLDFDKLDVTTFSWQKVLGGEGGHGVIILSPRAVERLETYSPAWPLPKIFRMTKGGKLIEGIFKGETINTPSMLCVADYVDALNWAKSIGGLDALMARADANFAAIQTHVDASGWLENLATDPVSRSNTSVCLKIVDAEIAALPSDEQAAFAKSIVALLDGAEVALDIGAYRDAPSGLRIWAGATVETSDLEALMPWLDWAFATAKSALKPAA